MHGQVSLSQECHVGSKRARAPLILHGLYRVLYFLPVSYAAEAEVWAEKHRETKEVSRRGEHNGTKERRNVSLFLMLLLRQGRPGHYPWCQNLAVAVVNTQY